MTRWRLRLYGEVEAPATLTWEEERNGYNNSADPWLEERYW